MLMPNRHGQDDDYKYGFNGMESDNEIKGKGNSLNFTFRMYDPRIARFISIDPQSDVFPFLSPYQYASNSPIACRDLEGLQSDKQFNATEEIAHRTALLEKVKKSPHSQKLSLAEAQLISTNIGQSNGASGLPPGNRYDVEVRFSGATRSNGFDHLYLKLKTADEIKSDVNEIVAELNKENNPPAIVEEVKEEPKVERGETGIKPKPKKRKKIAPTVVTAPPPPIATPTPITSSVNLDVPFKGNYSTFEDAAQASKVLTPILNSLKANSSNSVSLRPQTAYKKGHDILDAWYTLSDSDYSEDLVRQRGETITKWFTDRGVDASQINIINDGGNYQKPVKVTGTLTKVE
tara:strand:+ start:11608 stop:12651 length:1044 start_codon:yes stop_codon:yes gene_type:complete